MNVLVTGGAGYVGSTLLPVLLAAGHRVRVLDALLYGGQSLLGVWSHPAFEFVRGDIRDADAVSESLRDIDAVVHLAAIVGDPACAREPELARAVNLASSLCLWEESCKRGVSRFLFASTCSNYGKMRDPSQLVDETSELRPVSLYAETKLAVEEVVADPAQTGPMAGTALRFATIFGVSPRMRFDLTVNDFTLEMATRKHLVVFGQQFWRPYLHVHDIARAVALVLDAPIEKVRGEVFNVGATEQNYQKQQLVEQIHRYVPQARIEYVHKDEDPRNYRVNFAKIKAALGFEITRTLEAGIKEVLQLVADDVIHKDALASYRNELLSAPVDAGQLAGALA